MLLCFFFVVVNSSVLGQTIWSGTSNEKHLAQESAEKLLPNSFYNVPIYLSLKSLKVVIRSLIRLAPKALFWDPITIHVSHRKIHKKCSGSRVVVKNWCEFDAKSFRTFVGNNVDLLKESSQAITADTVTRKRRLITKPYPKPEPVYQFE